MGKQTGLYLNGKSGNILYYSWKEIPCLRTIPANVYQSPVVVAHKNANGLSTTMGASFRRLLADVVPYAKSMRMQTAVRLALLKWLKQVPGPSVPPAKIPFISELSFNEAAILKKCLQVPVTLTQTAPGELAVAIPQMVPVTAFIAPRETAYINIKIAAACCDFSTGEALQNYSTYLTIPYNAVSIPSQAISFSLQTPVSTLTMVAVALNYFTIKNGTSSLITNERFRPSQVIGYVVK